MKACGTCSVELKPLKTGVTVIEHAKAVGARRVWQADLWHCPNCKITVIVNFANKPVAEHFEESFPAALARTKELDPNHVFNVYTD